MNDFQPNQDICLVPYYPAYEIALPWYQDAELCHHVDNQNRIYDLSILKICTSIWIVMVICSTLNIRAFCAEMYACRQAEKFRLWSAKSIRSGTLGEQ